MGFSPWQPLWLPSLKPKQRLQLSLTTATVDMEATLEDMEATVDTVLATGDTTASVRPRPSPTTATEGTEATVVVTEAMVDTATAGATTESVRLMPSLRLLPSPTTASVRLRPSPTTAMEGTEATVVYTEAMVDTATAGATMASVRPRLSPTMAMEVMVDTVATEATEAMEVTVMASANNLFPGSSDESHFAQP